MVISQSTTEIRGLAVDWIGKRLYVTDATSRVVRVMTYDGKRKKQVISDEVYSPQAVTVDAVNRSVQRYNSTTPLKKNGRKTLRALWGIGWK